MSKRYNPPYKGHMVRLPEMTFTRLHVIRLKIMKDMQANPTNYPDRSLTRVSMADVIDMLIQTLPAEYRNE